MIPLEIMSTLLGCLTGCTVILMLVCLAASIFGGVE